MIKGIIFDLDGVLVFTDQHHYQAWKKLADRLGVYFDEEINHRLRGVSRRESLEILLENYHGTPFGEEEKAEMMEEKNRTYGELLKNMNQSDVPQSVRDTLAQLKGFGYLLAVGSSSKNAGIILERTELLPYFAFVSDGNDLCYSKPHPEVFLKAAKGLELMPEECAVVEDAQSGICAAKAAGMKTILMQGGNCSERVDLKIQGIKDLIWCHNRGQLA